MRTALLVTLLVCAGFSAQARTEPLENGVSSNHRYRVQVTQTSRPPHITYDLVRSRNSALLHRFESSYQPEEGELSRWSWDHAADASVAWSPDNHYVSVDEQVHRYIGGVLLAELAGRGVRAIQIPEQAIVSATKRRWDRQRIRHQRGWISPDKLSLVFAGKEAETNKDWYFEVILRIRSGKAVIISCRRITNQT